MKAKENKSMKTSKVVAIADRNHDLELDKLIARAIKTVCNEGALDSMDRALLERTVVLFRLSVSQFRLLARLWQGEQPRWSKDNEAALKGLQERALVNSREHPNGTKLWFTSGAGEAIFKVGAFMIVDNTKGGGTPGKGVASHPKSSRRGTLEIA